MRKDSVCPHWGDRASWVCELGQGPSAPRHGREGEASSTARAWVPRGLRTLPGSARCLRFQQTRPYSSGRSLRHAGMAAGTHIEETDRPWQGGRRNAGIRRHKQTHTRAGWLWRLLSRTRGPLSSPGGPEAGGRLGGRLEEPHREAQRGVQQQEAFLGVRVGATLGSLGATSSPLGGGQGAALIWGVRGVGVAAGTAGEALGLTAGVRPPTGRVRPRLLGAGLQRSGLRARRRRELEVSSASLLLTQGPRATKGLR